MHLLTAESIKGADNHTLYQAAAVAVSVMYDEDVSGKEADMERLQARDQLLLYASDDVIKAYDARVRYSDMEKHDFDKVSDLLGAFPYGLGLARVPACFRSIPGKCALLRSIWLLYTFLSAALAENCRMWVLILRWLHMPPSLLANKLISIHLPLSTVKPARLLSRGALPGGLAGEVSARRLAYITEELRGWHVVQRLNIPLGGT